MGHSHGHDTHRPTRQEKEPASDEVTEVAPNVLRFQLPINLPGLGHVNCYGLTDANGLAVVDPGLPGPATAKALSARLKQAGYAVKDIHTVVITHSHHDHFGGAEGIRAASGAEVVAHTNFRTWLDPDEGDDAAQVVLEDAEAGAPVEMTRLAFGSVTPWNGQVAAPPKPKGVKERLRRMAMRRYMKSPTPSRRVAHDEVVSLGGREWRAIYTPGHTPDHLCLAADDGVVLSGDHILPTITPHISGMVAGNDPLTAFFDSLDRMQDLSGVTTVLPAHGHPFDDLSKRAAEIKEHHIDRLGLLRSAAEEIGDGTVPDFMRRLFSERAWGSMAESETYAHLEHLRVTGAATVERDREGNLRFRVTPS